MAIKAKPAVKNELIFDNVLFVRRNDVDVHYPVRIALLYTDMLSIQPYDEDDRVKDLEIALLFDQEQMEKIVTLYNEWKDLPSEQPEDNQLPPAQDERTEKDADAPLGR